MSHWLPAPQPSQRLRAAKARGATTIVVDPRRTETARMADIHVQPIPGEDVTLFAGMIRLLLERGWQDEVFCARYVGDIEPLRAAVAPYTPDRDPWTFMPRMPDDKAIIEAELARVPAAEEGYVLQFAQFHASLTEGRDAPVTLADGRRSLELLSALYHAAQTGQRVMLPINESHPTYRGWLAQ